MGRREKVGEGGRPPLPWMTVGYSLLGHVWKEPDSSPPGKSCCGQIDGQIDR